jgi:hypothetical protein
VIYERAPLWTSGDEKPLKARSIAVDSPRDRRHGATHLAAFEQFVIE